MFRFLFKTILRFIAVLFGVILSMFLLVHAIPGNPWSNYSSTVRMMSGINIDKYTQGELDRRFGLDLPLWRQFTRYVVGDVDSDGDFFCGVVCGNLGPSIAQRGRPVLAILFAPPETGTLWESRFGYTFRLVLFGSLLAVGLGVPLGVFAAVKPKSIFSKIFLAGLTVLSSIPSFVLGWLAIIVLASWLKIIKVLPVWEYPGHWVVPVLILAIIPMTNIARVSRTVLMNILHADYVRTARAKGLTQARVVLVHVMRNALVPILAFMGSTLVEVFAGTLIVENLYSFPGFGREYWRSVLALDYPMILGLTIIYATGIMLVTVLLDIIYEILDPRLRESKSENI